MGDFCALFPRNPHFWKSLPYFDFPLLFSSSGMLHQLMPSTHIGVDMSPKWEKTAKKWRKNFEYSSYWKVYLTEQRDKALLSDITNSIRSSKSFLPRKRSFPSRCSRAHVHAPSLGFWTKNLHNLHTASSRSLILDFATLPSFSSLFCPQKGDKKATFIELC